MGFFNKYNQIEQELLEMYSSILGSREIAQSLLDTAIELDKQNKMPPMAGDLIIEKAKTDEKAHASLEKKRKEGVRDEDIRAWWNLHGVERMMMLKVDEMSKTTLYLALLEQGKPVEEALNMVAKHHPVFGNPEDTSHGEGDDRPLPEELKDRINIFVEKQGLGNPEYKKKVDSFSTFNALVRHEIRNGNI
ncbi:hypothetical protein BK005_01905 [bacterium CG10_37_50]|uniref:Uncharacterized protein n=1 Tax=Candidatus Campbellbacteria bacterium CG22_combo_CG10-13_8_21_14_all_36_13 TaxID=1974529 RepID=A0A2H0DZ55_9BACT|nr:MAG: hypothetical protein BK005_01905 [bacterium CG10_37_50]PIP87457.1 MAG: hypothetical protein COW81_00070 [Candidatus Campbellbacteria bacterium CG22_combo_CG10-13_8_21_14_all_36_13]